jgi:hypothetical protein
MASSRSGATASPVKPPHPDPVGRQQMVERAVHGFEECAAIGAGLRTVEPLRGLVETRITALSL